MRIVAHANLILTVPEPPAAEEGQSIVDVIMLAAEQYINNLGFFTLPLDEVETKLEASLRRAVDEFRHEVKPQEGQTRVGIRIHVEGQI